MSLPRHRDLVDWRMAAAFAAVLTAGAGVAAAQDGGAAVPRVVADVVLLAPADVRSEWTAALQIELAPRGARVIPGELPTGETVLMRDAEAQRVAIDQGAIAVARVEVDAAGWTLRVIGRDAAEARATPVAREADARTVALILVSLIDEPRVAASSAYFVPPPPAPPPAAPVVPDPSTVVAAPAAAATDASEEDASDGVDGIEWSGRIGSGGFGLVNDRRFIPGAMLRGGVGLRAGYFEGALLADAGIMLDSDPFQGSELQPLGRLCIEAGAAFPFERVWAFHFGARGCGGLAELRKTDVFDPSGGTFLVDTLGGLVSGGGYLAVSAGLTSSLRLYVRADVEGTALEASEHFGEVMPILSILLSFH